MANSDRRYINKDGKYFIPMNVEGNSYHENFFTTNKIIIIAGVIIWLVYDIVTLVNAQSGFTAVLVYILIWFIVSQFLLRYFVFEENYYYKVYMELKKLKESNIRTPAIFWSVASLKDTDDGCLITYIDGKLAYMIKLERDTLVGKPAEFRELHFDCISDFYKELNKRNYCYIPCNIMEAANKDSRISELDKLVYSDDNPNIQKLMQYQVGYIKNVTRKSYNETDYVLIYTNDLNRLDKMPNDITDCVSHLLDGAFVSYTVLDKEEISDLVKEINGVKYFNPTEATLEMFNREGSKLSSPFVIYSITYNDGEQQIINNTNKDKLKRIIAKLNAVDNLEQSIRETLYTDKNKKDDKFSEIYNKEVLGEENSEEEQETEQSLLDAVNSSYKDFNIGDLTTVYDDETVDF